MKSKKIVLISIILTVLLLIGILYFFQLEKNKVPEIDLLVSDRYIISGNDLKTGNYYEAENNKIISIDKSGIITALNSGTSKVYIKNSKGKILKIYKINISPYIKDNSVLVTNFELDDEVNLEPGELIELDYNVSSNKEDPKINWHSFDESIAVVDSAGKVLGKKPGTTIIEGKINDNFAKEVVITVNNNGTTTQVINKDNREIKIQNSKIVLNILDKHKIQYSVVNINESLVFTSSNSGVATVTDVGEVSAINPGIAIITLTTKDNKISASIIVNVEGPVETQKINISPNNININEGQIYYLKATVTPLNANQKITWSSSNNDIVSVDENGIITGKKVGVATITAVVNGGNASCIVSVTKSAVPISSISLNKSEIELKLNETFELYVNINPAGATAESISYNSSNPAVATVSSSGVVVGRTAGETYVTAKTSSGKTSSCKVTVVNATVISILSKADSIYKGDVKQFSAIITPSSDSNQKIIWTSSNPAIATIDDTGKVTGKSKGITTIRASLSSGAFSDYTIKVIETYKIHFLKTLGQDGENLHGDIIILESNGHFGLIDAGYWWSYNSISSYLTGLGVSNLDFFLVTHPHPDHLGAYNKIIPNLKPNKLYLKHYSGNDADEDTRIWNKELSDQSFALQDRVISVAQNNKIPIVFVDEWADGQNYTYLGTSKIVFYNIRDRLTSSSKYYRKRSENINSIVSYINMNGKKVLLYGDLDEPEVVSYYANVVGKAEIVKVGHHGINDDANSTIGTINTPAYSIITNWWKGMDTSGISGKIYFTGDYTSIVLNLTESVIEVTTKR